MGFLVATVTSASPSELRWTAAISLWDLAGWAWSTPEMTLPAKRKSALLPTAQNPLNADQAL